MSASTLSPVRDLPGEVWPTAGAQSGSPMVDSPDGQPELVTPEYLALFPNDASMRYALPRTPDCHLSGFEQVYGPNREERRSVENSHLGGTPLGKWLTRSFLVPTQPPENPALVETIAEETAVSPMSVFSQEIEQELLVRPPDSLEARAAAFEIAFAPEIAQKLVVWGEPLHKSQFPKPIRHLFDIVDQVVANLTLWLRPRSQSPPVFV